MCAENSINLFEVFDGEFIVGLGAAAEPAWLNEILAGLEGAKWEGLSVSVNRHFGIFKHVIHAARVYNCGEEG